MPIKQVIDAIHPIKIWTDEVEETALLQLKNCASLPFIFKHIACMPDVHAGTGATIGSVIPTQHAIIPAAVGVDIGCGMSAIQLDINADQLPSLALLRSTFEKNIPHGRSDNGGRNDVGSWVDEFGAPSYVLYEWRQLQNIKFKYLLQAYPDLWRENKTKSWEHLGTLGTGNHFLEVCVDELNQVWCLLHSGSRGIGNRIGSYFIDIAKKEMDKWFINLMDKNLAFLPEGTSHFTNYINAVTWAQDYALMNRKILTTLMLNSFRELNVKVNRVQTIDCHHNYLALENHFKQNVWVTRKGAIRARENDLGIIPGSMGDKSYIVKGTGNAESFTSCSHGAGRKMSRTKAKAIFSEQDLQAQTLGVECCKDKSVLDEIPGAYKNIDQVMQNQADLVTIVHTLKQVVNVKG